jgi:hypothetical protein
LAFFLALASACLASGAHWSAVEKSSMPIPAVQGVSEAGKQVGVWTAEMQ